MTEIISKDKNQIQKADKPPKSYMKENLEMLLDLHVGEKLAEYMEVLGVNKERQTIAVALNTALVMKGLSGDVAAYKEIRDTVGEKPVEKVETDTSITVKMSKDVRELAE